MTTSMNRIFSYKKIVLIYFVLIFILSAHVIFWAHKKEGFFVDEIFSYNYVCQVDHPKTYMLGPNYLNALHDPSFYLDYLTLSPSETYDFRGTYHALKRCVHPPLYYIFLKLICSVFSVGIFTKWTGIFLNLFFYILTLFLIIISVYLLTKSHWYSICACILYGISIGAVSTTIYIRMYMMLTFSSMLFFYLNLKIYNDLYLSTKQNIYLLHLMLIISVIFGILTHYYFIIFCFYYCIVFSIFYLKKKLALGVNYIVSLALAGIISLLIWPTIMTHLLFSDRGQEAISNLSWNNVWKKILTIFLQSIDNDLFYGMGIYFLIFSIILFIFSIMKTERMYGQHIIHTRIIFNNLEYFNIKAYKNEFVFLNILSFLFQFVTLVRIVPLSAAHYICRYIYNYYPIIIIFITYFFYIFSKKNIYIVIFFITFTCFNYIKGNYIPNFLYTRNKPIINSFEKNISDISITISNKVELEAGLEHELFIYYLHSHHIVSLLNNDTEILKKILKDKYFDSITIYIGKLTNKEYFLDQISTLLGTSFIKKHIVDTDFFSVYTFMRSRTTYVPSPLH